MSTRSIIAIPEGESWRGRYCHSDGYPTWNGRVLWGLVQRDGLDAVVKTITKDNAGWSHLDAKGDELSIGHNDGRFAAIEGYGTAYTTEPHALYNFERGQIGEDEWLTPEETNDTEWFYVLAPGGMLIGTCSEPAKPIAGPFSFDGPEPDWQAVENLAYGDDES